MRTTNRVTVRDELYSTEQVAQLLGLHVRTVRTWIRSGRLHAVRIGKEYRITQPDLDALTQTAATASSAGPPASEAMDDEAAASPTAEVSSIVQFDGVDQLASDRLGTLVLAAANHEQRSQSPMRVQTIYDPARQRLKIVILGGMAATAEVLQLLDAIMTDLA